MNKVLIALPNDSLGGAELYLKNLAKFYLSSGFSVIVLFLKKEERYGWSDFQNVEHITLIYSRFSTERFGFVESILNIWRLRNVRFNYVFTSHVHCTGLIGFLIRLNIIKKIYFVGRESTLIFDRFSGMKLLVFKFFYYLGYFELDLLICQTELMKQKLILNMRNLTSKIDIKVLPNPFVIDSNFSMVDFNVLKSEEFIVSAGRLIPEKGFDLLIDAFALLRNYYPNLKLFILGEGKERNLLERKISDLNLNKFVFLRGFVHDVYPFFRAAKLCVVSSRIEGFPNVLLQMMSQNTRVVSTKCAGEIESINGLFVTEANCIDCLFRTILDCLESSDNRVKRELFNKELKLRSVDTFVDKMYYELDRKK